MNNNIICPICEFDVPEIYQEEHHLIPLSRRPKRKGERRKGTVTVCSNCGDAIHRLINNNELAYKLNTVEKLKSDSRILEYIHWTWHHSFEFTKIRDPGKWLEKRFKPCVSKKSPQRAYQPLHRRQKKSYTFTHDRPNLVKTQGSLRTSMFALIYAGYK